MREEIFENIRLILGDSRDIMPSVKNVDVIITDPIWPNSHVGSIPGSENPSGLWIDACKAFPPHKRAIVVMRCDSDPRFLSAYTWYPFFRVIALPYAIPGYIGRVLGGDEYAYWFGSPVKSKPGRRVIPGRGPVAQPHDRRANGHPMSRAQLHFDWLVGWATDKGETVMDPFMGSGTTGVACAFHRLPFIGIEIEPRFFDIACRRVEMACRQVSLLDMIDLKGNKPIAQLEMDIERSKS